MTMKPWLRTICHVDFWVAVASGVAAALTWSHWWEIKPSTVQSMSFLTVVALSLGGLKHVETIRQTVFSKIIENEAFASLFRVVEPDQGQLARVFVVTRLVCVLNALTFLLALILLNSVNDLNVHRIAVGLCAGTVVWAIGAIVSITRIQDKLMKYSFEFAGLVEKRRQAERETDAAKRRTTG